MFIQELEILLIGLLVGLSGIIIQLFLAKGLKATVSFLPDANSNWSSKQFLFGLGLVFSWVLIGIGLFVGFIYGIEFIKSMSFS